VGDEQKDMDAAKNANIPGVLIANGEDYSPDNNTLKESFDLISEYIS
jgi:phosphoglycolate phosphatase-like HAD superfamily hydrolase